MIHVCQTLKLCTTFPSCTIILGLYALTLYDPGGGGALKAPPLRFFALTHLILELHYCALVTFPKK